MLDALLDCLSDLVVLASPEGLVRELNPAARTFFGARAVVGTPLVELLAPALGSRDRAELLTLLSREDERPGTGRPDALRLNRVTLTDDTGRPVPHVVSIRRGPRGLVLVARDGSEAAARAALERELAARDEFVAGLGHELRTPLNAVLGFAQLLELEDLPTDQRDDVERILTAGRHMQSLLDDVLDLARVRSGGGDLDVGPVPVLDVLRGVVELVEPLADPRGIRRRIEPATDCIALADRRRLWQVLLNLVGNAVKYGREGGTLRVGVVATGDRIRIEVEDDGPGIEPHALDRLFRPFERLGQEQSAIEGTGLGLAMTKALVSAMDGTLSAVSRLGAGTRFVVQLPAASDLVG